MSPFNCLVSIEPNRVTLEQLGEEEGQPPAADDYLDNDARPPERIVRQNAVIEIEDGQLNHRKVGGNHKLSCKDILSTLH